MDFEITPVAGKSRRFSFWATLALVSLMVVSAFAVTPPKTAQGYSWSAWTTRHYTAATNECKTSKYLATKFVGPIPYYSNSCVYRVRSRYAIIDDWAGWTDRIIQLENVAPYWAEAWGMKLEVRVHWNGTRVTYSPETLICTQWDFLIHITKTDCTVFGNNTSVLTARMAYTASFGVAFLTGSVDRGAQQSVDKTGFASLVTKWP